MDLVTKLGDTTGSALFRGRREGGAPALVKRAAGSAPEILNRARHEHRLLELLAAATAGVRPLALLADDPSRPVIVLEDAPGELLETILGRGPIEPATALAIAADLARALAELHALQLVHQDVRPSNVLADPSRGRAFLVDVSRAVHEGEVGPVAIERERELGYVSPEQTGRMNRGVDWRSDLYSLGVMLYRMLAGRMPFDAADPLEWVHCHVAREPRPPAEVVTSLPSPASEIAMRLLAKAAEDRYQSAEGLLLDLTRCLDELRACGRVAPFTLGTQDVSDRFRVARKLYGREAELATLLEAFCRVAGTGSPELVLIAGHAGIGKSSLAREIHKSIVAERGYLVSGKFDQYQREIPYATLTRALRSLVQHVLSEREERVATWRARLREAVGANGRLMTELVPQLELLLGPQQPVPALPPVEAQNRFQRVFQRLLGGFADHEHPLVLFLDDLQWADPGSLVLIEHLLTHPDTRHLLLVGAYRDHEVGPSHPLARALAALRHGPAAVHEISPGPLSCEALDELVADALRCEASRCQPLTRLLFEKTQGNPFFFIQFLSTVHQEGLLAFDRGRRAWRWDLERIAAKGHAENVVELLAARLGQLPGSARRVISLAGCLGGEFTLDTLALVDGRSPEETQAAVSEASRRGLLRRGPEGWRFVHDRVQEAAYALIPDDERAAVHLRIGRLLLAAMPEDAACERLFAIVGHLNRGAALIEAEEERIRLAELGLRAGRKAQGAAAYRSAAGYLAAAQELLPPDGWRSHYALAYALALERARCEWLAGDFGVAEEVIAALLREARGRVDRAAAYSARIDLLTVQGRFEESVRTGLEALALIFGLEFSLHPGSGVLRAEVEGVLRELEGRGAEDLLDLPVMTDPEAQAELALHSSLLPTVYLADADLHDLMICRVVRRSVRGGNGPHSSHGYVAFGLALGRLSGRWEEARRFGRLACDVVEKHRFLASTPVTHFLAAHLEFHVRHLREALPLLRTSFQAALEVGAVNIGCCAAAVALEYRLMAGDPLDEVAEEARAQLEFARLARYGPMHDVILGMERFVQSLRGGTSRLGDYDGTGFDTGAFEASLQEAFTLLPETYFTFKALARFLAGDFPAAAAAARRAEPFARDLPISFAEGHRFITALALAAHHDGALPEERSRSLATLRACEERLRAQAGHCPENFGCRHALVAAEIARIEGRDLDALRGYEEAIASARRSGFVHLEAIAHEMAARFHRKRALTSSADAHLLDAHACYMRWGAEAKVKALEAAHPQLRERDLADRLGRAERPPGPAARGDGLDFLAAARASQAISGEIVLARLLDTLIRTVIESAGARMGCLLLARGGELSPVARACAGRDGLDVQVGADLEITSSCLPRSILDYVRRTRDRVILADAAAPGPFSSDEALRERGARSVLCLPIVRQGGLLGVLYLENDLVPDAFTPDRMAVLELLAAQAAISVENATLYEDLERRVEQRTAELNRANDDLRREIADRQRIEVELRLAQKLEAVGRLAAGVAHEINTPLQFVSDGVHFVGDALRDLSGLIDAYRVVNRAVLEGSPSLSSANDALRAEEAADLEYLRASMPGAIERSLAGLGRIAAIVRALKDFGRPDQRERVSVDLHEAISSTLTIARHEYGCVAEVKTDLGEIPRVLCCPGDVNQALLNIIVNAAHAISDAVEGTDRKGLITIRTRCEGDSVVVAIGDTGGGIPEDIRHRIFDPFFTTKDVGMGSGQGLAMARSVLRDGHGGDLTFETEIGKGTTFFVRLPVHLNR